MHEILSIGYRSDWNVFLNFWLGYFNVSITACTVKKNNKLVYKLLKWVCYTYILKHKPPMGSSAEQN